MATSPPVPSPKSGTASPTDSLRRDSSKKEGVKGWMGTLTRRKKTDEGTCINPKKSALGGVSKVTNIFVYSCLYF